MATATGRIGALALGAALLALAGCAGDAGSEQRQADAADLTHSLYAVPGVIVASVEADPEAVTVKLEPGLSLDEEVVTTVRVHRAVRASEHFDGSALTVFTDDPTGNPSGSYLRWQPSKEPRSGPQLMTDVRLWQDFRAVMPAEYLFFDAGAERSLSVRQLVVPGERIAEADDLVAAYSTPWERSGGEPGSLDIEVVP